MSIFKYEITEEDLKNLILEHMKEVLNMPLTIKDINILVKSKQNWKSEWEIAFLKQQLRRIY